MWTLPPLWTHRTRPQGFGNLAKNARFPQRPHRSSVSLTKTKNEEHNHSDQLSTESDHPQDCLQTPSGALCALGGRSDQRECAARRFPLMDVVRDILAHPAPPFPDGRAHRGSFPIRSSGPDSPKSRLRRRVAALLCSGPPIPEVPSISSCPSQRGIERARALWLTELMGDFPFVSDAERAHALGLGLLPFLRDLISGPTPLHLIEKPSPGTGAGLPC